MSSWGCCDSGSGCVGCATTPGTTFSHPITLNVYHVLPSGEPGTPIVSVTQRFDIPFRPSARRGLQRRVKMDTGWWRATVSRARHPDRVRLSGRGITLPDQVIASIAFNTTTWGYQPIGTKPCSSTSQGCGYDSLNVGVQDGFTTPAGTPPSPGTFPRPDDAYYNSATPVTIATAARVASTCSAWTPGAGPASSRCSRSTRPTNRRARRANRADWTQRPTGPTGPPELRAPGTVAGAVPAAAKKKCKKKHGKKKCKEEEEEVARLSRRQRSATPGPSPRGPASLFLAHLSPGAGGFFYVGSRQGRRQLREAKETWPQMFESA